MKQAVLNDGLDLQDNVKLTIETGEITKKQNLFDIGEELEQVFDALDQIDGEPSPEAQAALEAWFESISDNLDAKIDAYCALIEKFTAHHKIRKAEADRIGVLAKTDLNNATRLKDRLKLFMEVTGNQKMETKFRKVRLQNNGGVAPLEWIEKGSETVAVLPEPPALDTLPPEYVVNVPTIDIEAIRSDLEGGLDLPFARIGERGKHVRI